MPKLLTTPFAIDAEVEYRTNVQVADGAEPNSATYRLGFPPMTMRKISEDGKPPKGSDLNGVLYDITDNIVNLTKGIQYGFDATYANAVGGYPKGAVLRLDNGVNVESEVESNTVNPNVDMTGWKLAVSDSGVYVGGSGNQKVKNSKLSKNKLGHSVIFDNLASSIDTTTKGYHQGGCKVGNSLFLKISNNKGNVGTSTEEFIITEYDFNTGVLKSETQPMQTLGHHELSGFIKDGKTYLLTSYQPESAGNRSGVGISVIEWKGSETTLENAKQYLLLADGQNIGFPCCDETGENVYMTCVNATGGGFLKLAPLLLMNAYNLADIENGITAPKYSFNIEIPAGDGLEGSNTLNGLTATKNHIYIAFGGAYGLTQIQKYSVYGELLDSIQTALGRSARPQSEVFNSTTFLYNSEPEAIFVDNDDVYTVSVEDWYGNGDIVEFNGSYYMARYDMTGRSPSMYSDHWVQLQVKPSTFTIYNNSVAYKGRNTEIASFKRVLIKITLKNTSNFDLMITSSCGSIPKLINNISDRVHIYGNLSTSKELNFGMYDHQRRTFQKNLSLIETGFKIYDTRINTALNNKSASVQSLQADSTSLFKFLPSTDYSTDCLNMFGRYHGSADNTTQHPYLARFESDTTETAVFYRDGRFFNYSKNTTNSAKFFLNDIELMGVYGSATALQLDTDKQYMFFGQSKNGAHFSATLGMNHEAKIVYPPSDGATALGASGQRFGKSFFTNLNLSDVKVFADNASAKAGGVAVGDPYRTSTGQLMIVY